MCPDAYEIHDSQFLQVHFNTSGVAGLSVQLPVVPAGIVRTYFAGFINCSVAETQDYWWSVYSRTFSFPVTRPVSFSVDPTPFEYFPLLTEGMELKLFPGESLIGCRDAATAGSTISAYGRFVDTDLQYYVELDKHKVLRRRMAAMQESSPGPRRSMGGAIGPRTSVRTIGSKGLPKIR